MRRRKMADVKQIIAQAIELEKYGVEYYRKFHELVADDKAKALMKSLSEDEKSHAELLTKELAKLGGKSKTASSEEVKKSLAAIFPERIRRNSIVTKDSIAAIKLGIRTEERSIEYYTKNSAAAGPKLKKIFDELARMEKGHKELLEENLHYLENEGSWYGYVPILEG